MQNIFIFIGREQGKKEEIKPSSGYYLMQQERGVHENGVSTEMLKLPSLIKSGGFIFSGRIKSIEMKSCNIPI